MKYHLSSADFPNGEHDPSENCVVTIVKHLFGGALALAFIVALYWLMTGLCVGVHGARACGM